MSVYPLIPYFTTSRYRVSAMVELAEPKPGETGADLGSGDGRIVIAFAEKGIRMHGFEIDPMLKATSEQLIQEKHLTSHACIHERNFWEEDLGSYDIITIYPMPDILQTLEEKLRKELTLSARILTNYYPLPTWKPKQVKDKIYLYTLA